MTAALAYEASRIKRNRRTRNEMDAIRLAIAEEVAAMHPQTVRQVFYQMVVQGVVPKVDDAKGYGTVQRSYGPPRSLSASNLNLGLGLSGRHREHPPY